MAENPILKDLSGNGHDATCYNFAWSGMSGIGGYKVNFNEFKVTNNDSVKEHTYNKLVVYNTKDVNTNFWDFFNNLAPGETYHIDSYKVRISGLSDEETIIYRYYNLNDDNSTSFNDIRLRNGINIIPEINMTSIIGIVNKYTTIFQYILNEVINKQITIELLPEYPNALVSDGVDDYVYVKGLPILTDYTVIAKRKWLQTEGSNNDNFAAKGNNLASFLIEKYGNNGSQECYSFGQYNGVNFAFQEDVIYQTKESYNGSPLKVGTAVDVDNLVILARTSAPLGCIQAALYSFLLFDRTLTADEIEWVKTNLISVSTNE